MSIYIGLGSNIGNELGSPRWHMGHAAQQLINLVGETGNVRASSLYKSLPMGPQDQPDYYNAVVELTFSDSHELTPLQLLEAVQQIEQNAQRERLRHWGERSLDADILLYDNVIMDTDTLTIPHKGMLERNFVAVPLFELDDTLTISGRKLTDLTIATDMTGLEIVESSTWIHKNT